MIRSSIEWEETLTAIGAFWVHSGNPKDSHALLTSDYHSGGFCNAGVVLERCILRAEVVAALIVQVSVHVDLDEVDCVVGPAKGATLLAIGLAEAISHARGRQCAWASPIKVGAGERRRMMFDDPSRQVHPGDRVLVCEDTVTTGGSVERTVRAVLEAGGELVPFIPVIFNRSGMRTLNSCAIAALVERYLPIWEADECPLCQAGSVAVRPKANWETLTATK